MRDTFIDAAHQAALERDGFVVVPFLTDDEVEELRAAYDRLGVAPGDPKLATISTFHTYDSDYKRATDAAIRGVFERPVAATFDRQRVLPASYLVKWPGEMSGCGIHQDLSHVDEREHWSVGVWAALEDTDAENGQIWFVPGSHEWVPTVRGIQAFPFPYGSVAQRVVEQYAVPVPVHKGQAIVFTQRVLHFSMPNRTDTPRFVAIANLIPTEAAHLHYFGDGEGDVDVYEIDDSFWFTNNPFTLWKPPPVAQLVGKGDWFAYEEVTDATLDRLEAEGRAVPSGHSPGGPINAVQAWCYRCGTTEGMLETPDPWVGNTTLLCPACQVLEGERAPTAAHAGLPVG